MNVIKRALVGTLLKRLSHPPNFIQIVVGPRQVGKTTALEQVMQQWKGPSFYASADLPSPPDALWIQTQWNLARQELSTQKKNVLLVLDEVQKIHRWADVVKALVDEDRRENRRLRVVLLGSSSLNVKHGAQESLAGRFELLFCPHWSWPECRQAFGWTLEEWLYFGGYPGAASLINSRDRWVRHMSDALVEAVLSRDVLQMTHVTKPALLRQLFMLAVHSPAQILSYNKMLGQLQDAGNTVTLAHYLKLLASAYLVSGLDQWSQGIARVRSSSPKLVVWNNALTNAFSNFDLKEMRKHPDLWGRLVENAVGAYVLNQNEPHLHLYYWHHENEEVDYVLERGGELLALEVKSGKKSSHEGLKAFLITYPKAKSLLVGTGGVPLEKFFSTPSSSWF